MKHRNTDFILLVNRLRMWSRRVGTTFDALMSLLRSKATSTLTLPPTLWSLLNSVTALSAHANRGRSSKKLCNSVTFYSSKINRATNISSRLLPTKWFKKKQWSAGTPSIQSLGQILSKRLRILTYTIITGTLGLGCRNASRDWWTIRSSRQG